MAGAPAVSRPSELHEHDGQAIQQTLSTSSQALDSSIHDVLPDFATAHVEDGKLRKEAEVRLHPAHIGVIMAEDVLSMYEILSKFHPVEENPAVELDARRQWHSQVETALGSFLVATTPPSPIPASIDIDIENASTTETDAESLYHRDTDSSSPAPSTPRRSTSTSSSVRLASHAHSQSDVSLSSVDSGLLTPQSLLTSPGGLHSPDEKSFDTIRPRSFAKGFSAFNFGGDLTSPNNPFSPPPLPSMHRDSDGFYVFEPSSDVASLTARTGGAGANSKKKLLTTPKRKSNAGNSGQSKATISSTRAIIDRLKQEQRQSAALEPYGSEAEVINDNVLQLDVSKVKTAPQTPTPGSSSSASRRAGAEIERPHTSPGMRLRPLPPSLPTPVPSPPIAEVDGRPQKGVKTALLKPVHPPSSSTSPSPKKNGGPLRSTSSSANAAHRPSTSRGPMPFSGPGTAPPPPPPTLMPPPFFLPQVQAQPQQLNASFYPTMPQLQVQPGFNPFMANPAAAMYAGAGTVPFPVNMGAAMNMMHPAAFLNPMQIQQLQQMQHMQGVPQPVQMQLPLPVTLPMHAQAQAEAQAKRNAQYRAARGNGNASAYSAVPGQAFGTQHPRAGSGVVAGGRVR